VVPPPTPLTCPPLNAIACFGDCPPVGAAVTGCWIFSTARGPFSNQPGFVNVAVDVSLSGCYGDAPTEWPMRDAPLAVPPWQVQFFKTPPFPVPTVYWVFNPITQQFDWGIKPFWTRFMLSDEQLVPVFAPGLWDGSGRAGGYQGGETEDWVTECDPSTAVPWEPPQHHFGCDGQVMLTLDVGSPSCAGQVSINLTASGDSSLREFRCDPQYVSGTSVYTDWTAIEMSGTSPTLGPVVIHERADQLSIGKIEQIVADAQGNFVSGHFFTDVLLRIELPNENLVLDSGPIRIDAGTIHSVPDWGSGYVMPAGAPSVPLYVAGTTHQVGWLCNLHVTVVNLVHCCFGCSCELTCGTCCANGGGTVVDACLGDHDGDGFDDACCTSISAHIVAANPPLQSPYVPGQPFRDVLQNTTPALAPQGIGVAGTPAEGPYTFSTFSATFDSMPSPAPAPGNVTVSCTDIAGNGQADCPSLTAVVGTGPGPYQISLSNPPPPRECITFTFAGTAPGQKLQYQVLPGDLDLNSAANTLDLLALVQHLNDGTANLPANQARYNVDRSSGSGNQVNTIDLLRLVQLLNGTSATQAFNGTTVAACPP
ncbi:MAG TPA: hypothetical protein VGM03_03895, partial [Phycisphaerae bacterium]